MNISFNLRDVFLCLHLRVRPEVIKELGVLGVDLLLLPLAVLLALPLDLVVETEEHLVTVRLVVDRLLLDQFGVFEFQELLLRLQKGPHLFLLLGLLLVVLPLHLLLLVIKSLVQLLLLFSELPLKLFQFGVVLIDGLSLLINLLLQGARDLQHVPLVLSDILARLVYVLLQVLQAHGPLV